MAENVSAAGEVLAQIAASLNAGGEVRWKTPLVEAVRPLADAVDSSLSEGVRRERCLAAGLGITEADHALADSGTLVLESGSGRSRMVSLLPPVHVALLPEKRIVPDLATLVERYQSRAGKARLASLSCLTFVTGPSRTADIELTLTVGVHGPQQLHVIIIRDFD
jgi:L-lactate dehydrogenase complex protein LldG